MKKLSISLLAMAAGVALTPVAFAGTLTIDHITATYTLTSDITADQGTVTLVNAYIENTSSAQELYITGFQYYLGGSAVPGAAGDSPSTFLSAGNGWTYSLGQGSYSESTGTAWSKNSGPNIGLAVDPKDNSRKNYLSSAALINGSGTVNGPDGPLPVCYVGETLGDNTGSISASDACYVELQVAANYGGVIGSSSSTFLYGYAEGVEGHGTYNVGTGWTKGPNTTQASGMEESIDIQIAPEPGSLVLLGTGLLGLAFVAFRKSKASRPVLQL